MASPSMDDTAYLPVTGDSLRHTQATATRERLPVAESSRFESAFNTISIQSQRNRVSYYTEAYLDSSPMAEEEISSNETATLHLREASPSGSKRKPQKKSLKWWWWWEIAGSLISIISISLIVPVLKMVDNKPLDVWSYSIRPNSLISVLTTISKSSMTVSTASCLGQLKWDHFQYRPNPLDHLQIYDDASRGPWGSFLLLCTGRLRVVTAWAIALVTLVALGIEPSAQQILETPTRQSLLPNITAQIGIAKNYSSEGIVSDSQFYWGGTKRVPAAGLLNLQTAIASGIVGSVPPVNFYCPPPSTQCTWPPFSTLAVCSNFSNLTNIVKPDCTTNKYKSTTWGLDMVSDVPAARLDGIRRLFTGDVLSSVEIHDPQPFSITWNYCIKTYSKVLASPTGIHTVEYTSTPLLHNDSIPAGIQRWNSFSNPSSNTIFNLTSSVQTGLWQQLSNLLSREIAAPFTTDSMVADFSVGEFMLYADLAKMTRNIEETLSNQIRSSSPGDNGWAEMWAGQAFYEETYWHVNWSWILLPVIEVLLAASLLVISITFTRDQPLFKSSALALLYHGFDDIGKDSDLRGDWDNNPDNLENMAKYVDVELKEDSNGSLKFVKVAHSL
ncbi:hypothetical protein E0Z10_g5594 [Xylaria hypoxylon]|uniref:Uncharacterized protein n=1 Tax=Xylaria hypoxylon TaxID=37992 RepID=A0A4Z0YVH2_9PEZI|nr:hypothetical protein E0Z10_g5594 [Xylaria hypoxylon]